MPSKQKALKSLKALKAFDGEKQSAEIHRDLPLPKCEHKDVKLVSGSKLVCKCGASWQGPEIMRLYKHFTS